MKKAWKSAYVRPLLISLISLVAAAGCISKNKGATGGGLADGGGGRGDQGGADPFSNSDSPLVDKFLKLLSDISNRAPELNREKDRRGKLRIALGANLGVGCMQDVPVKSVEVSIDGQKLGDNEVTRYFEGKDAPPEATGFSMFEISFGDNEWQDVLTFTNDETKSSMFGVGTRKTFVPSRDNFTIGKIQRIRIKKTQAAYQITSLCDGATFTKSCTNQRKIKEVERYHLASLKIKVNNELIYAKGNLSHAFANHLSEQDPSADAGLVWADDHAEVNETYVKMKQRDDCTALQ